MSDFVEQCRKEWRRLGVPTDAANEMAADLSADLAEAEADGASPEEVLGNGVFDARTFAATWAAARGLVEPPVLRPATWRQLLRPLVLAGVVSVGFVLAGLAVLGRGHASFAVSAAKRVAFPFPPSPPLPPKAFLGPRLMVPRFILERSHELQPLGFILLGIGLVGLGVTLFLWKPWRWRPRRSEREVGLPSYY